jgi:hypothetical protein
LRVALGALEAWTRGRCWLGRSVARGTGWFRLEVAQVAEAGWDIWPDSSKEHEKRLDEQFARQGCPLQEYLAAQGFQAPDGDWAWRDYRLTLKVAAPAASDENAYGVEMQEGKQPQAGALLASDARLASGDWRALPLKMHGEDEFACGVYGNALFDRLALARAVFTARLALEAKKSELDQKLESGKTLRLD